MKIISLGPLVMAALLGASAAGAADLPRRDSAIAPAPAFSPAPAFTWTGFYLGLNAGYGFGRFTEGGDRLFGKANGGLVGGTAGFNQQFGALVLGLEGDWGWSGVRSENVALPGPATGHAKLTNLATLRGRAGYAFDNALLYATGGYAGGTIRSNYIDTSLPVGAQSFSTSNWNNGFAVGGGIEYAFSRNISLKGEYLYTSLASKPIFAAPRASDAGLHQNLLRAGVNYRF